MVVARFSSGGVAICHVLPVLWMTPHLHIGDAIRAYAQSDSQGAARIRHITVQHRVAGSGRSLMSTISLFPMQTSSGSSWRWRRWKTWNGAWNSWKRRRRTALSVTWPPTRLVTIYSTRCHVPLHTSFRSLFCPYTQMGGIKQCCDPSVCLSICLSHPCS